MFSLRRHNVYVSNFSFFVFHKNHSYKFEHLVMEKQTIIIPLRLSLLKIWLHLAKKKKFLPSLRSQISNTILFRPFDVKYTPRRLRSVLEGGVVWVRKYSSYESTKYFFFYVHWHVFTELKIATSLHTHIIYLYENLPLLLQVNIRCYLQVIQANKQKSCWWNWIWKVKYRSKEDILTVSWKCS